MADWIDQISELRRLKNEGALSDEEFEAHRRAIMAQRSSATESDHSLQNVESLSPNYQQDTEPVTGADSFAIENGDNLRASEMPPGAMSQPHRDSPGAGQVTSKSSLQRGRVVFTRFDLRLTLLISFGLIVLCATVVAYQFFAHPATVTARSPAEAARTESSSTLPPKGATAQVGPTPGPGTSKAPPISQDAKNAASYNAPKAELTTSSSNMAVSRARPNVAPDTAEGDNPGLQAMRQGDLNSAIRFFTNAIEGGQLSHWDLTLAYVARGNAYLRKNEPDHARRDADSALSIEPGAEDARKLWFATTVDAASGDPGVTDPTTMMWTCHITTNPNATGRVILYINLNKKTVKSPNFGEVGRKLFLKQMNSTVSWNTHIESTLEGKPFHSESLEMLDLNSGMLNIYSYNSAKINTHYIFQCASN